MKILINVVNARNIGGGFQVVYNFLVKTQEYITPEVEWFYAVSECLDGYLDDNFKRKVNESHYFVFPNQPDFKKTYWKVKKQLRELEEVIKPNIVYSPLAPGYFTFKNKEVIRFANAWSTNANIFAWKTLSFKSKYRMKIYNVMQRALLKKSKYIITQTETVRQGLLRVTGLPPENVFVVPNVLPAQLQNIDPSPIQSDGDWIEIAAIGGQMPHKNLEIIPDVIRILKDKFNIINVRFHTTLPHDSLVWQRLSSKLKELSLDERCVFNHGAMRLSDLANVYKQCRYCFIPSVLETFSASIIEAMYFDLKTVATDLPFNKEVMEDACLYFEPMNADSAANKLYKLITSEKTQQDCSEKMNQKLQKYIDFRKYYDNTIDFLIKVANNKI